MQTRSARGGVDGSGSQTQKPRYLTPDQLRTAGDIARATFHANAQHQSWNTFGTFDYIVSTGLHCNARIVAN